MFLPGKKLYITGICITIYAVIGAVFGQHDVNTMIQLISESALGVFLRAGIAKIGAYNKPK